MVLVSEGVSFLIASMAIWVTWLHNLLKFRWFIAIVIYWAYEVVFGSLLGLPGFFFSVTGTIGMNWLFPSVGCSESLSGLSGFLFVTDVLCIYHIALSPFVFVRLAVWVDWSVFFRARSSWPLVVLPPFPKHAVHFGVMMSSLPQW